MVFCRKTGPSIDTISTAAGVVMIVEWFIPPIALSMSASPCARHPRCWR